MIDAQDIREFHDYLRLCTDDQLQGVLKKEQEAGREEYVEMTKAEIYYRRKLREQVM